MIKQEGENTEEENKTNKNYLLSRKKRLKKGHTQKKKDRKRKGRRRLRPKRTSFSLKVIK